MSGIVRSTQLALVGRLRAMATSAVILGLLVAALPARLSAQAAQVALVARESVVTVTPPAELSRAAVRRPAVGERASYDVRLAGKGVGSGSLEVLGEESVNGYRTLHAALEIHGGLLFAKVNDRFDSWMDADHLFSRRFIQDQKELRSKRYREYEFAPEQKTYHQVDNGEQGSLTTNEPLDDVSFLFYVRTLPLHVGDVDTIPRYFKSGHDVIIRVLRKQHVDVPAGSFETIVVQPTITNAGGLFGQGGRAEVYFSDDSARTLVMMRSHVPVLGSLSLYLKDFRAAP
jgi:hypothetical protein